MRKMVPTLGLLSLVVLCLNSCLSQPVPPLTSQATRPTSCSLTSALQAVVTARPPTGYLAFSSDGDIYVMQADGSHRKQLTNVPGHSLIRPGRLMASILPIATDGMGTMRSRDEQ